MKDTTAKGLANPPRKPLKSCPYCGCMNEPSNTRCVDCLKPI